MTKKIFLFVIGILTFLYFPLEKCYAEEILYKGSCSCDGVDVSINFIYDSSKAYIKSFGAAFKDVSGKIKPFNQEVNDINVDKNGEFSGKTPSPRDAKLLEEKFGFKVVPSELVKGVIVSRQEAKGVMGVKKATLTESQIDVLESASGVRQEANVIKWLDVSESPCDWHATAGN